MHPAFKFLLLALALVVCGYLIYAGVWGQHNPVHIPEGAQTLTGTLIPAELSLTRRGTHVLKVDNDDVAYVESPSINLRALELTEVVVTGTFHLNADPSDLPVLVVTSAKAVEIPAIPVEIPAVGLTVRVPAEWNVALFDDGAAFTLTGSTSPLLRVSRSSLTLLPAGAPMFVAGADAVRIAASDGGQTIHILGNRGVISLTWNPDGDVPAQTAAFAQLLRTAVLRGVSSSRTQTGATLSRGSSMSVQSAGSSGKPIPCGGPAGVLCPAGSFCSVTGADGVGTCVPLR